MVRQRCGVKHLAKGNVGRTARRLGAGDAAHDAEQSVERVDGALGVDRISDKFLDTQLGRASVQRDCGGPTKAGDEIALRRDRKLQTEERDLSVLREGKP